MTLSVAITFPLALGVPGGGTRDCLALARGLAERGAEVVLVPTQSPGPTRFPRRALPVERARPPAEAGLSGVEVAVAGIHPAHYLLDGVPVRRAVRELLGRRRLDACLGWWHEAAWLAPLLRRRGVVFAMNAAASYGLALDAARRRPLAGLRTRCLVARPLRRADVVLARSCFTRDELVSLLGVEPERIRVVHGGVDPALGRIRREAPRRVERILYCARLSTEKGILDAVAALGRVAASGRTGWTLRVAGPGDAERVRAAARESGIAERVELLGELERPALLAELERAHLALLPSRTESFGLANAEAQAAGLAVVAYAAGAVPEVVADGATGWLAPTGNVEALAERLGAALDDPAETHRRGLAGRERVLARFTWERTAEATLAGLHAAVARNPGKATRKPSERRPSG